MADCLLGGLNFISQQWRDGGEEGEKEGGGEVERERERELEFENLFFKDCSLGSVKNVTTSSC